ncbi:hypothetical protein EV195_10172 [Tenacibaculum skagerrakense]|uniref:Lipocalin-like protein n=1 Tax=Tenacibaculum skagerrakense TaxID=186571 RepID=A0A4R2NZX8_9FLAO|nr:hypothetical protein [Tenacibaculum skagerrakense]TCP27913.1 hypothetical protein EV195_10172 [Tenacibaculum skagerrakense]
MKKIVTTLLFVLVVLTSCTVNDDTVAFNPKNLLVGHWTYVNSDNGEIVFKRSSALPENEYGVSFLDNKKFIERTSGFCGTPPLVFWNVVGTYQLENELIKVTKEEYPTNFKWKIKSLTNLELVVSYELTDQQKDHEELMNLFNEIYTLATSINCEDADDWLITAYGTKACGGPQGYLAYPNSIDVNLFLEKVSNYTQKEHEYNIKWSIVSTCDVPIQPIGVKCENNIPVLIY